MKTPPIPKCKRCLVKKIKVFPPRNLCANELLALYVGKKLMSISRRMSPQVRRSPFRYLRTVSTSGD